MTKQELIDLIKDPDVLSATADKMLEIIESGLREKNPEDTHIIGTPVKVTEKHVGCLVRRDERPEHPDALMRRSIDGRWETAWCFTDRVHFPSVYPIPITRRWFGGPCPVDDDAEVLVQLEDGSFMMDEAGDLNWYWDTDEDRRYLNIIGYTVLDVRGIQDGES